MSRRKRINELRTKINQRYTDKDVSRETKNIIVPEYNPHFLNGIEYYTNPQHGHVHPFYMTNADYNTDSASYYDYLAKFNELLKALIDQVNDNTGNIDLIFDMLDDLQNQIDNIIEIINNILDELEDINDKLDNLSINTSKWVSYDNTGNDPWYPLKGTKTNLIPIPNHGLHDFQTIDIIWADVNEESTPPKQTNLQHNQYTHNGVVLYNGTVTGSACVDVVGSAGAIFEVFPYSYYPRDNYLLEGTTEEPNIKGDIALGQVMVVGPTELNTSKDLSKFTNKQKMLVERNAPTIVNRVYEIWSDILNYSLHLKTAPLLTKYLNTDNDELVIQEMHNFILGLEE